MKQAVVMEFALVHSRPRASPRPSSAKLLDRRPTFRSRTDAKLAVFGSVEGSSNTTRRHSTLGNRSTARVESDQPAD